MPMPRHCARPCSGPLPGLSVLNEADQIKAAATCGFVFNFCGIEMDRDTGQIHTDKHVAMHNPGGS